MNKLIVIALGLFVLNQAHTCARKAGLPNYMARVKTMWQEYKERPLHIDNWPRLTYAIEGKLRAVVLSKDFYIQVIEVKECSKGWKKGKRVNRCKYPDYAVVNYFNSERVRYRKLYKTSIYDAMEATTDISYDIYLGATNARKALEKIGFTCKHGPCRKRWGR